VAIQLDRFASRVATDRQRATGGGSAAAS